MGKDNYMVSQKKYWDNLSYIYDLFITLYFRHIYKIGIEEILSQIKPRDVVLDIATGTGIVANRIAAISDYIYGIDISYTMLNKACKKLKSNTLKFINMNAEYLGFKCDIFDKVICFNGIHVFRDPVVALNEMKRVVKPEGYIITITPCYGDIRSWPFKLFLMYSGWLYLAGGTPPYLHQFDLISLLKIFNNAKLRVISSKTIWPCPPIVYICAEKQDFL